VTGAGVGLGADGIGAAALGGASSASLSIRQLPAGTTAVRAA